jgi:hypothetical protein
LTCYNYGPKYIYSGIESLSHFMFSKMLYEFQNFQWASSTFTKFSNENFTLWPSQLSELILVNEMELLHVQLQGSKYLLLKSNLQSSISSGAQYVILQSKKWMKKIQTVPVWLRKLVLPHT